MQSGRAFSQLQNDSHIVCAIEYSNHVDRTRSAEIERSGGHLEQSTEMRNKRRPPNTNTQSGNYFIHCYSINLFIPKLNDERGNERRNDSIGSR